MNLLLIGNAVSMVGCLIMVGIGFLKKKSHILLAQSVQCAFMGFGNLILGGVSGFIANMVSILRNLVFAKAAVTTKLKVFFIALQVLLSINSLGGGLVCWLPLMAAAVFTWFLDTKSEVTLKVVILSTQVMWLVYDISYQNYIATTFDVLTLGSNLIGFFMVKKEHNTKRAV